MGILIRTETHITCHLKVEVIPIAPLWTEFCKPRGHTQWVLLFWRHDVCHPYTGF